jgi:hypothetical protein
MITYQRKGGLRPPPNNETLRIKEDGTFTLWRSVSLASIPPSPIGRFSGVLAEDLHLQLQDAARTATASGNLAILPRPDSVIESIDLPGAKATLGIHDQAGGPWGRLIGLLRPLLGDLTRFPRAAIALEVLDNGQAARLIVRGADPLRLDLSKLEVQAILWRNDSLEGRWSAAAASNSTLAPLTANAGWALDLPFDHGFAITADSRVVAYAYFDVFDGEKFVSVSLQTP